VLVPLAAELGINIGVTGREPLNNQPYFRMTRLGDGTPVHSGGREAFDYMLKLIAELSAIKDAGKAQRALAAYIAVRRTYQPRYETKYGDISISPEELVTAIANFTGIKSEGGRRAQAVAAGLLDVFAGTGRVESGRINDPSRKYPGDICIRTADDPEKWEKAIEVRDKPVSITDVQIFCKKCIAMGVRQAAVVMVSEAQEQLDTYRISEWASSFGIGITLFRGWKHFVDQVLFWSEAPKPEAASEAAIRIGERLISVEASPESVTLWHSLVRARGMEQLSD
jgi:hypothetical protein